MEMIRAKKPGDNSSGFFYIIGKFKIVLGNDWGIKFLL